MKNKIQEYASSLPMVVEQSIEVKELRYLLQVIKEDHIFNWPSY